MSECRKYKFYGRVQGVGFRANTASMARQFEVTGSVENLQDGTVQLIACGQPEELDRFVEKIRQTFPTFITKIEADRQFQNPDLNDFRILY